LDFDRDRIAAFLEAAGEVLDGEWLLAGGAAAIAWFATVRTTEDIDLVPLESTNAKRVALLDLAAARGLPIEAVNSTVDYFVRRVPGWREHLEVLHAGPRATIYRPDATLFLLLKVRRLSETDLADCLALVEHCVATGAPIDREQVLLELDARPRATILRSALSR
jgi:hypothetical protein